MLMDPIIYIVDPRREERMITEEQVAKMGIEFEGFESIEMLLPTIRRNRAGCVFAELQLGRLTVFHLIKVLEERHLDLPVVLLTSRATVPVASQAFKSGAFDLLEKPSDAHQLWECAYRAFDVHAVRQRTSMLRDEVRTRLLTLTQEERQVLEMMLSGTPNKRMAAELELSQRTIVFRRKSLMHKMGAKSLGELASNLQFALGKTPAIQAGVTRGTDSLASLFIS